MPVSKSKKTGTAKKPTVKTPRKALASVRVLKNVPKYLKPTTDIAFKKLFGTQERSNLTISFLNTILEKEGSELIKSVTITDSANLPETIDKKKSYVDVNCVDQSGKKYIIEMQVLNEYDFAERVQYYVSLAISRQLKAADEYKKLVPVIFVGVLGFNLDQEEVDALSHHRILNQKTGKCLLRHLQFHFVELEKFKKNHDQITTAVDKWIYFMKNASTFEKVPQELRSKDFSEAFHVLESAKWTDAELDAYMNQEYAMGTTRRQQQGAREEGKLEGKLDGKLEVAREMLADGDDINKIARVTKLDIAKIKQLQNKQP